MPESSPNYVGRLAPSPTGLLHLGHARTFWIALERARAAGGKLWLRDEDLDPQRSRPEFSAAMKGDLRWLGISWDAELRQSDRLALYRAAMQQLLAAGLAYPCICSRRDLAQSIAAPHDDDDEPIYNGRCRPSSDAVILSAAPECSDGAKSKDPDAASPVDTGSAFSNLKPHTNYRFRIPTNDPVTFTDVSAGSQTFTPSLDFGDFLLWRKDNLPSYQLACVVDDAAMGITEVVRGRDLLKSTARQILLQRALSLPTPTYYHCDLMRDATGVRLAKRHDALSLRTLRDRGLTPAQVRAMF
jgi:glutamyl-tRNA synthetase